MMRHLLAAGLALLLTGCLQRDAWTASVPAAAAGDLASAAPTGRLPEGVRPITYRAALDLDPREPRFSGRVEIDIELDRPVPGLWLHGDDLDVASITITAGRETLAATWAEVLETGVVWVGFPRQLEARQATLTIDYDAAFNASLAGLFRVDAQGKTYALAKSESIEARRFLPGFDEPGLKAVFELSITVPEGMQAIANTPEIARVPARHGFETIRFAPTRPLSTYLLSTAVGDFDKVTRAPLPPNRVRNFEVPLAGYARAGKGAELDFALNLTPPMMQIFEEMLQQPYPYEKLDLIAAPQWPSGATELAAAITYREARILKGPNAGPALVRAIKEIHAHEIAHMWFGNLVTPPWWDDLWLKEAFAVWSETAVLSVMEPDGEHEVAAVADGLKAMGLDSLSSARAVASPIGRNEDIRNAYDAITYSKGQSIIRMVDHYFTPGRFRPALGRYIARYADGEANSADFYAAIADATGEPAIGEVFRDFVTRQGVPSIEANVSCGEGEPQLALRQSRYKPLGSAIEPDARWTVPVCVAWMEGAKRRETCTLLREQTASVRLESRSCPAVIIPNAKGAGYYRFNLPPEGWRALGGAFAGLPATEALASLDSAEAAFNAGTLSGPSYLGVLLPALAHPDSTVLASGLRAADSLLRQTGDAAPASLRSDIAAALDARPASGDEADAGMLSFRGLTLESPDARAELRRRLAPLLDGAGGLSSDLYVPALRIAFEEGGTDAFEKILAARESLDDAVFTQAVADAIGAVGDPALARRAEDLMFKSAFGGAASSSIAASLMSNPQHREETWARLKADFPAFLSAVPAQSRRATPRLARAFCDAGRIPELDALFAAHGAEAPGHEQALAEAKESLTLCTVQAEAARAAFEAG